MSWARAFSTPDLIHEGPNDHNLEGIGTNVKLLLKLIQEHTNASTKDIDDRKMQRVAGMMSILDDVKTRIQKSQNSGKKRAELRRCNTELRPRQVPNEKKPNEPADEKERLANALNASMAARKSLEIMCSSLGKEKIIMAAELSRKVQELNGMEELINDLKAQNEMLRQKVQTCAAEHKERKCGEEIQGNADLQERNKALSEQLLRSLDGYRSLKRKLRDAQEESAEMCAIMEEMEVEIQAGLGRIRSFRERMTAKEMEEEITELENMFECFIVKVSKHGDKKKSDCVKS